MDTKKQHETESDSPEYRWVSAALALVDARGACVRRFLVRARDHAGRPWTTAAELPRTDATADETVEELNRLAESSSSRYVQVGACLGSSRTPASIHLWRTSPDESAPEEGSSGGLAPHLKQLHQHNETLLSQCLAAQRAQLDSREREMKILHEQRATVEQERLQLWELVRSIMLDDAESQRKNQRGAALTASLTCLAQAAAYRLSGATLGQSHPATDALRTLAASLDETQLSGLQTLLRPEQIALLASIIDPTSGGGGASPR
jgi:hypothetical protein